MTTEYIALRVAKEYVPLKNEIDENVVNTTITNNEFLKWYQRNKEYISQNIITYDKLNEYFNETINKELSNEIPTESAYSGDKNINNFDTMKKSLKYSAIVYYLFSQLDVHNRNIMLLTPQSNKGANQIGGGNSVETKIITSNQEQGKLIMFIKIDQQHIYYIKMTINRKVAGPQIPTGDPELRIYHFFKNKAMSNNIVKNYVLDTTSLQTLTFKQLNGYINNIDKTPMFLRLDNKFALKIGPTNKFVQGIKESILMAKQDDLRYSKESQIFNDTISIITTNGAHDVVTLEQMLKEHPFTNFAVEFLKKTIVILYNLNTICGFVHWDLHTKNILCKKVGDNSYVPFMFDFDMSTTDFVENMTYFNIIKVDESEAIKIVRDDGTYRKQFGLFADILRLFDCVLYYDLQKIPTDDPEIKIFFEYAGIYHERYSVNTDFNLYHSNIIVATKLIDHFISEAFKNDYYDSPSHCILCENLTKKYMDLKTGMFYEPIKLQGGSYYHKYMKYKMKYLKIKKI